MMMHSTGMLMMAAMSVLTVAVIAAAVAVAVWLTRTTTGPRSVTGADDAEVVLRRRYAAGEIDDEEYRRRLATLRGQPPATQD